MNYRRNCFLFLAIGMLVSAGHCVAWVPDTALVREERSLEISILQQEAHIRMRSRFHNSTQETHIVRSWMPFSNAASEIHIFANAEGTSSVEFTGQARLDALADAAEKEKDVRFFRLAEQPWTRVFRTKDISVKGDESLELVWEWTLPVEQQSDFDGIEIFLNDGVSDGIFQVEFSLALANPLQHFWSPFLTEAIINRSEFGVVALQQRSDFLAKSNFWAMWSGKENPMAEFYTDGYIYRGHFRVLPPPKIFHNVTVLIDNSGSMSDVWLHVQELLRFLLEHQEDRSFRVALTSADNFSWIVGSEDSFEENTSNLRQKILETVAWNSPLGQGNISEVLQKVSQPREDHLVIVFSDEKNIEPIDESAPLALLQFFPSETSSWQQLVMVTRGIVQKAFRSIMGTYEAEELLQSIASFREPLHASEVLAYEGEEEILPDELVPQFDSISPVFVGRKPASFQLNVGNSWFEWFPKYWATMNIVQKLEKDQREQFFSTDTLDAILAIARTFGVSTSLFTSETTRMQLQKNIADQNIWSIVENLLKKNIFFSDADIHLLDGVPLWHESDGVWRAFNFRDRVTPERWIKIAPFSAAERQLFVLFPEIFAEPFGVGENVEFCTLFRCFSVVIGGREEALPSDRAFVRDFDPDHWAIPFVVDLVGKGLLEPELNGKLHLDRAISRGEFVRMLVLDRYGPNFKRSGIVQPFSDIDQTDVLCDIVNLLVAKGVLKGFEDGTFRPLQDLTRAEAVKILLAFDGVFPTAGEEGVEPMFSDTTDWSRPWVEEAAKRGIVQGYGDGTFHPQAALTRAEAAKVIVQSRK